MPQILEHGEIEMVVPSHIQVKKARFNEEVADEGLPVAAMKLPDGTHLFREHVDGALSVYKAVGGKLLRESSGGSQR